MMEKYFKPTYIVVGLLFVKLLLLGLVLTDCLGALVFLFALEANTIISYLFPKRADLFKEVLSLQLQVQQSQTAHDELKREVMAMKFTGKKS